MVDLSLGLRSVTDIRIKNNQNVVESFNIIANSHTNYLQVNKLFLNSAPYIVGQEELRNNMIYKQTVIYFLIKIFPVELPPDSIRRIYIPSGNSLISNFNVELFWPE